MVQPVCSQPLQLPQGSLADPLQSLFVKCKVASQFLPCKEWLMSGQKRAGIIEVPQTCLINDLLFMITSLRKMIAFGKRSIG